MNIILASQSPRRRQLLKQLGLEFAVAVSSIEETIKDGENIEEQVKRLALSKVEDVSKRFTHGVIIGADTLVVLHGKPLGKPRTVEEARNMLQMLNGSRHQVLTGVVVKELPSGRTLVDCVTTNVTFRHLTDEEIEGYLSSGEYSDKAGAYAIQGLGAAMVKEIEGCYFNVVGLPLARLTEMLKEVDVDVLGRG
ncbi:MAG: septum formation inhibitor Maf [Thermoanaerobacteraceae bacterium]|nr:septum formation inhibitor Maf [Thermoanaerobacteraceae bacterium]